MVSKDPTEIKLQSNVKKERDPLLIEMEGTTAHKGIYFKVPYMTNVEGDLWQGGADPALHLPHFIKHYISVAPWFNYQIKHELSSALSVVMYDSLEQSLEQVDAIAAWVNVCRRDGPTLVHCQAGLNRSSLVVARALMMDGRTADEAITLLRKQRSSAVLSNQSFEDHLRSL